ncbi:hypothetical protein BH20ACI4_BH20ACI4_03870 [soil metagenome]
MITNKSDFQQKPKTKIAVKLLLTRFDTVGKSFIGEIFHFSLTIQTILKFHSLISTSLNNKKLSLYLIMTCLNGYTIDIYGDSLAESLIKSEGGAYAVWVSSGATHIGGQTEISRAATDLIFKSDNKPVRIGEIVRTAKQMTADQDIRKTWQIIGDPTMFVR